MPTAGGYGIRPYIWLNQFKGVPVWYAFFLSWFAVCGVLCRGWLLFLWLVLDCNISGRSRPPPTMGWMLLRRFGDDTVGGYCCGSLVFYAVGGGDTKVVGITEVGGLCQGCWSYRGCCCRGFVV